MHNLFSHAHEPEYVSPRAVVPYEDSAVLEVPVHQAFDGFTDAIHLWWPVSGMSVFGDYSHVAILRDHLVEESEDGEEVVWAEVLEWDSPEFVRFRWTLGEDELGSSEVDIRFEAVEGDMTRVSIACERAEDAESDADNVFVCDWSLILARYVRFMGGAAKLD